uniref:Xenotropic and polytropic retrovirus receptor 1b n=1 Tax=Eptatretus burgeri TaxID=7764 RepID=A0A8C4QDU4_EPTBU
MKFAEHLTAHITPEWRKQYIQYETFKEVLYAAREDAPPREGTDEATLKRYYARMEEKFFQMCEKELSKINTFYSEKLAEAQRGFSTLQNELQSSLEAQREGRISHALRRRKRVFQISHEQRVHYRNLRDLKLAFSEFYLSLILLQNYQNLNFTGFRKILKKHDKILETTRGADWRVAHVETAPFYTNKKIDQLIIETEATFTNELEGGERQKAMKRLRVPPLGAAQPSPPWTTCRVGLYCGMFIVLVATICLTGNSMGMFIFVLFSALYNSFFALLYFMLFCDSLSSFLLAGFLGVLWCLSLLASLLGTYNSSWIQAYPLALYGFMFLFLVNPTKTCYYKSRVWLIKRLFRAFTSPVFKVQFADFWIADQLNSLGCILMDLEYTTCFYIYELNWTNKHSLWESKGGIVLPHPFICNSYSYGLRAVIQCIPAWIRFAQCLRRYHDSRRAFPHLLNAGKYSTVFFVVAFAALYSLKARVYFYLWLAASLVSTFYTLTWDLKMDWGLFDKNAGENTFLREEIVYPQKAYYYMAILGDSVLRFTWAINMSIPEMGFADLGDILVTILAPLEVFRRFVWNFFRLENEHLNNCGEFRAVRDISVAPLNSDDQTLLEQMMDQEDGVKNRRLKRSPPKRHYSLSSRLRPRSRSRDTRVLVDDTDDETINA